MRNLVVIYLVFILDRETDVLHHPIKIIILLLCNNEIQIMYC